MLQTVEEQRRQGTIQQGDETILNESEQAQYEKDLVEKKYLHAVAAQLKSHGQPKLLDKSAGPGKRKPKTPKPRPVF